MASKEKLITLMLAVSVYLYLDISTNERSRANGRREPV